jgi:hypothetical protein
VVRKYLVEDNVSFVFLKKVGRRHKIKIKQNQTLSLTSQAHMPDILENGPSMLTQPGSTACPSTWLWFFFKFKKIYKIK